MTEPTNNSSTPDPVKTMDGQAVLAAVTALCVPDRAAVVPGGL